MNSITNFFKKSDGTPLRGTPAKSTPGQKNTPVTKLAASVEKRLKVDKENGDKENATVKKRLIKNEDEMDTDDDIVCTSSDKNKKRLSNESLSEDMPKVTKRRRVVIESDSDTESTETKTKVKTDDAYEPKEEDMDSDEDVKPVKAKAEKFDSKKLDLNDFAVDAPKTNLSTDTKKLSKYAADTHDPIEGGNHAMADQKLYKHFNFAHLWDDKIKDINGRLKSHPEYDPRTLFVPPEFRKTQTPALRQWWDLKANNFDVIFFFKVGKFYELYHQDAVVAVKELGLTFMKGDYAHAGFPEIAFSRFADSLVSKGYKVGRVEQTEKPDEMLERVKGTKQDKTVRREICRVTTPGTKTFNLLDSDSANTFSNYLYAVIEKSTTVQDKKIRQFGLCFVDTTVGTFFIGQFEDDRNCSKFRTTLAQYPPAQILYDRNLISKETKHIIDLQNCLKDALVHEKEMFSSSKVLRLLLESNYFKENNEFKWPENFQTLLSDHDTLGLTPKDEYDLALNAMGGVVWCLKNCLIDEELLTMKTFEIYKPVDNLVSSTDKDEVKKEFLKQKYMVLDSISLTNLEIFENNFDNTQTGTLYEQVDWCSTSFGRRLLKYWLVNPLCDPAAINDRLDAIDDLKDMGDIFSEIKDTLKSLPDLERLVSKIHQLGNVNKNHPDSRAVMYENDTYSKKKVEDFVTLLNGFGNAAGLLNKLKDECFKSKLLKSILTITKNEKDKRGFPYLEELLEHYKKSFDPVQAKKDGKIIPSPGINEEYDSAIADIQQIEQDFAKYLKEQSKQLGCNLSYFGTARNRYQMEMPESKAKKLPVDFELTSSKKGYKRYWTDETKDLLAALFKAEDRREEALRNTMKNLFKKFDHHYTIWNRATQCLSILDVLMSLATYVRNSEHDMCRPEIVLLTDDSKPFIDIKNGRHPCLMKTFSGDFIPNDVLMGCADSNNNWQKNTLVILTGPNMGGKSTLMRQTGLTIILAQMGCYVPAESCRLSPTDRIFTRIGASDKILAGESTFYMELSETASILHHATKHSLVLMDELGRGTATFDGTAIAYSVVKELAQKIKCRTLFSTHYHHLVEEFTDKDDVSMGHMESMVNDDDQSITFLYKFGEGAASKSHGFNAAKLADIPEEICKQGLVKSVEFEGFSKKIQLMKKLMHIKTKSEAEEIFAKFEKLSTE